MKYLLFILSCMLLPSFAAGQYVSPKDRPGWVAGCHIDRPNSYMDVVTATGNSMDVARTKAVDEVVRARSLATGTRVAIEGVGGKNTVSSKDELTVKCRIVDEYRERLSPGIYRVSLLVQTAKNPEFDFEPVAVTDRYPFSARVFVPGMAQLHKGSTVKGYAFIAGEVAAIGGIITFESLRSSYESKIGSTRNAAERRDYINKADNMRNVRNGFIAGAVAIYAWNVIDGVVAKGKKHVVVGSADMRVAPYASARSTGVMVSMNF